MRRQKTSSCILGASVDPLWQRSWDGNSHEALGLMSKITPPPPRVWFMATLVWASRGSFLWGWMSFLVSHVMD